MEGEQLYFGDLLTMVIHHLGEKKEKNSRLVILRSQVYGTIDIYRLWTKSGWCSASTLTVLTWAAGHRDLGVSVSQRLLWYQGRSESLSCSLAKLVPECFSGRVMVEAASSADCLGIHWQLQRTIKCRALPRSNAETGWNCSLISDIFRKNKKIPDKTPFQTSFSYRDQDAESTCNEVASSIFLRQLLLSRMNN